MPPQKTSAKKAAPPKAVPAKQKKVIAKEASDEDDDDDDDDEGIDEDDVDEDVSLGSVDEDEDLEDEEGSDDLDEAEDDGDDDDEDDDEEDEEVDEKPAKKAKIEEKPVKKAKANDKVETPAKAVKKEESKKEDAKKTKNEAETETKNGPKEKLEDRASAVGPVTAEEAKMFEANFRAMSATSIFVGKLPQDTTDDDLKKLHPSIRSIRRPVSRKGLPATFGFLNFANKDTADRALKEIKKKGVVKIRGQEVLVSENGSGQCHPPSTVDRRKLRIYGCPKFVTAETIKKSLPGCVDVLLGDKDKGNAIEAVAVFRTSAEARKILLSQPTLTLNECVCALFYLNISHNVKQHERKKDRKQAKKQKESEKDGKAAPESDDQDDSDLPADKVIKFKKENVKPQVQSAKKNKKRPAPSESDDENEPEEQPAPRNKKVSYKSPQKTPVANAKNAKKTPMRKGTPFKKAKTAA